MVSQNEVSTCYKTQSAEGRPTTCVMMIPIHTICIQYTASGMMDESGTGLKPSVSKGHVIIVHADNNICT
jgi:hypothetical protein